jgi:hypothetical protein
MSERSSPQVFIQKAKSLVNISSPVVLVSFDQLTSAPGSGCERRGGGGGEWSSNGAQERFLKEISEVLSNCQSLVCRERKRENLIRRE